MVCTRGTDGGQYSIIVLPKGRKKYGKPKEEFASPHLPHPFIIAQLRETVAVRVKCDTSPSSPHPRRNGVVYRFTVDGQNPCPHRGKHIRKPEASHEYPAITFGQMPTLPEPSTSKPVSSKSSCGMLQVEVYEVLGKVVKTRRQKTVCRGLNPEAVPEGKKKRLLAAYLKDPMPEKDSWSVKRHKSLVATLNLCYTDAATAQRVGIERDRLVDAGYLEPPPPPISLDLTVADEEDDPSQPPRGAEPGAASYAHLAKLTDPYFHIRRMCFDAAELKRLKTKYFEFGYNGCAIGSDAAATTGRVRRRRGICRYPEVEPSLEKMLNRCKKRARDQADVQDDLRHALAVLRQIEYYETHGCVQRQPLPWDCAVDIDDDPEDGLSEVIVIKDHGSVMDVDEEYKKEQGASQPLRTRVKTEP